MAKEPEMYFLHTHFQICICQGESRSGPPLQKHPPLLKPGEVFNRLDTISTLAAKKGTRYGARLPNMLPNRGSIRLQRLAVSTAKAKAVEPS